MYNVVYTRLIIVSSYCDPFTGHRYTQKTDGTVLRDGVTCEINHVKSFENELTILVGLRSKAL